MEQPGDGDDSNGRKAGAPPAVSFFKRRKSAVVEAVVGSGAPMPRLDQVLGVPIDTPGLLKVAVKFNSVEALRNLLAVPGVRFCSQALKAAIEPTSWYESDDVPGFEAWNRLKMVKMLVAIARVPGHRHSCSFT